MCKLYDAPDSKARAAPAQEHQPGNADEPVGVSPSSATPYTVETAQGRPASAKLDATNADATNTDIGGSVEDALRESIRRLRESEEREKASALRISQLQEATAELAAALSAGDVASVLLSVSERVLGAAAGVVYLTGADERKLFLQGARGVPPPGQLPELTPDTPLPLAKAIRQRQPLWYESYEELLDDYPSLANSVTPRDRLQAVVAMPLFHARRLVGAFALSFSRARSFDENERRWLTSLATQCAVAAERARLYQAERDARDEAETLLRINESVNATTLDLEALVQRLTDETTKLVGANFGAFFYNVTSSSGEAYMLYSLSGAPKEAFAKFGLPRNTPLFSITFSGQGVLRLDDVRTDPRYGTMAPHHGMPEGHLPVVSYLAVPVISRSGGVLGGLFLGHREPGRFTEAHERMVTVLAASAATAIDTATLFAATKVAEQNQRRLVDELTETVRLNDLLAGVLAHDLRNPLGAVLNSAQLALRQSEQLQQSEQGSQQKLVKPLHRIISSGERMSRMIEQLLDYARIRVGSGITLEVGPLDFTGAVRRVVDEFESVYPDVSFGIEALGDSSGSWDEDRLFQALSNVVGNAVQHGQRESGVRIRVDGRDPNRVRATVHNMGAIPAHLKDFLFVPLGRQQSGEKAPGLGLGLFITREIAKAHGGSVDLESTPEAGTTFTLALPRIALSSASSGPQARQTSRSEPALQNPRLPPWDAAEQFGENAQKFRLLVESVKDYAIFMLDTQGCVATWNAGAERIKGYAAHEIIGKHFSSFYEPSEARSGICERELEIAAQEGRFEAEGYRVRKDGSRFWANVVITALRHKNGDLVGFAKVTRDLTDRKTLEEERLLRARAEEALRLRDEFLSVVSHEFKTPLSILQLQIEALSQDIEHMEPRFTKNLERARRCGDQLLRLVDSVLEVTRIATGSFALRTARFDLAEAVEDALDTIRPAAALAGCDLTAKLERALIGSWDRARITHAIVHLLENAITYAAHAPIQVTLVRNGELAVLNVADRGPGIAAKDVERIFERFERASSMRHHSGLGLGLYLAREVALAHGGSVRVEPASDSGADFSLRLPLETHTQHSDSEGAS